MSVAKELVEVLKEEEHVVRNRQFEAFADIQKRKNYLVDVLSTDVSEAELESIRSQAQKNEKLLGVMLTAVRGLNARFMEYGRAERAVGYGSDGERLSCDESVGSQRV